VLQTDGQLKTGKDIAIATLLGAEEWGVATAALVAGGCIMMRKCHLNTCPVGVATQDPELRKLFSGKPEHIVNLFRFIAEELREIMAELGFRTINDMVGRVQFLKMRDDVDHWKVKNIDLSGILYPMDNPSGMTLYNSEKQDHNLDDVLDWELVKKAVKAIESKEPVFASFNIKNTDRTTGTILTNEITKKYQSAGLPQNTINYTFTGSAGQSFGAFCTKGICFELCGEANDYVGKGLSGAQLVIYPSKKSKVLSQENIIIGNVALYGATSGDLFVRGQAGERFAVRNSGAIAVVEGVGDTDTVCAGASFGKWVFIRYDNGLSSTYGHLSVITAKTGQRVTTGDIVGYSGNTGYSTGPHLHMSVYAGQGVQISTLKSTACKGTYTIPLADTRAYLDPLIYL
jgi:glutamate synthase (NADPH/NADH) large chain